MADHGKVEIKEAYLKFLDNLRASGITNMFGEVLDLRKEFPELNEEEAIYVLSYWMTHSKG